MSHIPGASGCMNWEYLVSSLLPLKFFGFFLINQKPYKILVYEMALKKFHFHLHHSEHQKFVLWTWSEGLPSKRSVCYQLCCCTSHAVQQGLPLHQKENRADVPLGRDIRRICTGSHSSLQVDTVFLLHGPGRKKSMENLALEVLHVL